MQVHHSCRCLHGTHYGNHGERSEGGGGYIHCHCSQAIGNGGHHAQVLKATNHAQSLLCHTADWGTMASGHHWSGNEPCKFFAPLLEETGTSLGTGREMVEMKSKGAIKKTEGWLST